MAVSVRSNGSATHLMALPQLDSNLALFLLLVASCFVIVRLRLHRPGHNNGGRVLPPSPPGLPIIGNMHQLGRGHHHRKLQALARRHGDIFLLQLGAVPTLVVSSASTAEEVLRNHDHVFCGRPQQHTSRGILYDCRDVAFSPYGERWRQLRRIAVVHLLSVKRVDSLRLLREEEVASLMARIHAASSPEDVGGKLRAVNLSELIVNLSYTVTSRAAFGNKLGGMDPGTFRAMMKEVTDLLETIAVSDMFPRLWWLDWAVGLDARIKRTAGKLDDVLERALQEHEKRSESEDEAGDLLDDLLSVVFGGQGGR
jgi:cytochrome P450 family 71 subfamily A